ncbi:MAG: hypothetical protein ACP5SJ_02685, partial [Candidatus Micrarchaeia archaeon]
FMPSSVMSSAGPTGEAPQLSTTYGAYDNGAYVFDYYTNFAGTGLPSGWACNGCSVNNNLTIDNTGGSGSSYDAYTTSTSYSTSLITEVYGQFSCSLGGGTAGITWAAMLANTQVNPPSYYLYVRSSWSGVGVAGATATSSSAQLFKTSCSYGTTPGFYSIYSTPSTAYGSIGTGYPYSNVASGSSTSYVYSTSSAYITLQNWGTDQNWVVTYVRQRAVPPNGVMPSVTVGSVS